MDFLKEYGLTDEDEIKEIIEYLISKGFNKDDIIELLIYKTELFYETKDKVKEIYETN